MSSRRSWCRLQRHWRRPDYRAETEQLQQALDKSREQGADRERSLHTEIIGLKKMLLERSMNKNKELEESVKYEPYKLQATIKDLRQAVKESGKALIFLRKRQGYAVDMQSHLEEDIQQCSQTSEQRAGQQRADCCKNKPGKLESTSSHVYAALKETPAYRKSPTVTGSIPDGEEQPLDTCQSSDMPTFCPLPHTCETLYFPRYEAARGSSSEINTTSQYVQRWLRDIHSV
ncbi:uncharacterized protein [Hoplias malabaricus]|uniref:uncharacterized protein n=1 Tax=Hoplias malabaricus TaxID=27720 RepID=UPI003461F0A3